MGIISADEIKDDDDSFCTSTSLKSEEKKNYPEERKISEIVSQEITKVRSQLDNLNAGIGTFNEIEDGSFAMKRRSIIHNG